jgi:hypothetical protein
MFSCLTGESAVFVFNKPDAGIWVRKYFTERDASKQVHFILTFFFEHSL